MPAKRNSDLARYTGLNPGTQYTYMHGPYENWGVYNGQFEQGPSGEAETDPPEGWLYVAIDAGGTFTRTTGGYAGNWCASGGNAGMARGVDLYGQKYLPVNDGYVYYYQLAACHANNGTIRPGLKCYDAAKGALADVWMAAAAIPATAYPTWTLYYYMIGPGLTALTATTRYVRPIIRLQVNAALTNAWAYVDDVKIQQVQRYLWPQ